MKATFYGHATVELETGGKKLLFDPFITLMSWPSILILITLSQTIFC
jgi:L-ascorbate metabolism protein UlaG (beta-lactamase superfamily)